MKALNRVLIIALIVAFAGCTVRGHSSEFVTYYLDRGFLGHPVNEFFSEYGFPENEIELSGGGWVYYWASVKPPLSHSHIEKEKLKAENGDDGVIARQYCELHIYTDKGDNIEAIRIAVDSMGKWSTSRCSEIFNKIY